MSELRSTHLMFEEFLNIIVRCHCGWQGRQAALDHYAVEKFKCPLCGDDFRQFPLNSKQPT